MAHLSAPARDVLYMDRGPDFPLALEGALFEKTVSHLEEVRAQRAGVLISYADGRAAASEGCIDTVGMPSVRPLIPLQLLAYHVACVKGRRGPDAHSRQIGGRKFDKGVTINASKLSIWQP